ncbi:MAG TPA: VWA domain-containing protein [Gaiellales bacterium]
MTFASPIALWALLLVPLAVIGYLLFERRRVRESARFVSPALLPNVVDRVPGWRRHLPIALLLLAVTSFLFGFARPHATISVRSQEATVVLAIDTSRSMGATDVAPSRLAAAQSVAHRFVAGLPSKYRVSVISFSTRAQVVAAPTTDRQFAESAIDALRVGQGTALGDGIANALQVADGQPPGAKPRPGQRPVPAAILILSDGASDGGKVTLPVAIQRARAAKVPVFTGLFGTQSGIVQVPLVGGYIQRIEVPPNATALQRAATQTGGRAFVSPTQTQLAAVYRNLGSRLGHSRKDEEITVAFAALGAFLLIVGCGLSSLWFRRIP